MFHNSIEEQAKKNMLLDRAGRGGWLAGHSPLSPHDFQYLKWDLIPVYYHLGFEVVIMD